MGRKPTPQPLMLADSHALGREDNPPPSAETASLAALSLSESRSPRSQRSSPFTTSRFIAPNRPAQSARSAGLQVAANDSNPQHHYPQPAGDDTTPASHAYPPISSAFDLPSAELSPQGLRHVSTDGSKPVKAGFFQFNKGSRAASQTHQYSESRGQIPTRGSEGIGTGRRTDSIADEAIQKQFPAFPSRSDLSLSSSGDHDAASQSSSARKNKSKSFGLLSRTKSNRDRDNGSPKASPIPVPASAHNPALYDNHITLRTAPVAQDRTFRDMMNSTVRNRSEDRALSRETAMSRESHRDREHGAHPSSLRETGGLTFLSGLRNSSTRAADMISKGLFGKGSRSGSTNEREPLVDDEHYRLKVINMPLVEQARLTRISKRLENSRDKTEFWMPAFPWRAIDYLNYKGCEVEGLYRVPGSGPQIKKWQRRFDERYDVNLFEEHDLYDINIIGSMLKAWLRELPDELFPKEAQDRIARECIGAEKVPQLLVDELSNLSPFKYYLLFAITCHLSLLLAHSDKNKMDFRNLCICFQPCMKIDAFCFKFLVCDWRDCWKGCKNEPRYIEEEYMLFDQPPPRGLSDLQPPSQNNAQEDRDVPSPDHGKPSHNGNGNGNGNGNSNGNSNSNSDQTGKLSKHQPHLFESNASIGSSISTVSTTMTADSDEDPGATVETVAGLTPAPPAAGRDIRPLSPIQPLSPLGF